MQHKHITAHDVRQRIRDEGGINAAIAVFLTKHVGSMTCAYLFALLAIAGFPGLLGEFAAKLVQWTSQTFIQLTLLSVIMVGQSVLSKHQEMVSENSYEDIVEILQHLDAQDKEMNVILQRFDAQDQEILKIVQRIEANS